MLHSVFKRKGATVVEFAVVAPITMLLLLGLIVGGVGIYRYQEVSHLAREATRYASTHGGQYTIDQIPARTGVAAVATQSDIQAYVNTKVVALNPDYLSVGIAWSAPATIIPNNIPTYVDTDPTLVPPAQIVLQNYVSVTVTYQWMPEIFFVGPLNLTSTSKVAMIY